MKKRIMIFGVALLLLLVMGSCRKEEGTEIKRQTEFQRIELEKTMLELAPGRAFAVTDNGEFFVVSDFGDICRYSADGTLLKTYEKCGDISALCVYGNKLFFYTHEDELKSLSLENGKVTLVTDELWFTEIKNLVSAGNYLYAYGMSEESGQIEDVLKSVDPKDGYVETIETETGLRAVYGSADGTLYYCTDVSGGTYLYSYEEETGESVKLYDLTNRPEAEQPVQTFVCEQGFFVYTTLSNSMVVMSLEQEKATIIPMKGYLVYGKDLVCATGNVVYQTFFEETMSMQRETFYLADIVLEPMEDALSEFITVFDVSNLELDEKQIKKDSGIRTKFVVGDVHSDEFLAEIMAGNPEVDIYVLTMSSKEAQALKEKGIFTPLNSSEVIQEYQKVCFPYIAEGMKTNTGDIWMLPVAINTSCIWYVEENLEQFQVTTEQFRMMDSFIELSKEMTERLKDSEFRVYAIPLNISFEWMRQYDKLYCDFAKGVVNYNTEVFKKLFETVWDGWCIYDPKVIHPYYLSPMLEGDYGMWNNHPQYKPERVIYKYTSVGDHLTDGYLNGWRVIPAPVISEEIQENDVMITGLILNPYSSKKELAMTYLESVAKNPLGIYGGTYQKTTSFLFEDINVYENFYDISLPATKELYEIFKDGRISANSYPYYQAIIFDYQEGRLSLDEAVARLQRETDMWLNE